jgi:lysyl-tRNA synthetase class 2
MASLKELRNVRIAKLQKLRSLGIDPYPAKSTKEFSNQGIIDNFESFEGKQVSVAGRLMSWREHGNIIFGHIQDETGKLQLFVQKNTLNDTNIDNQTLGFADLRLLDVGDFVEAVGIVTKTARGEVSVIPSTIRLLTKSIRPLPEKWEGLKDQEIIFRQRYLDLVMNPVRRELFKRKAHFWGSCRAFMKKQGFLEVETPILEHVTGGADAKPFMTHHNALDEDFYLRISSELYQKRLISGGFEKIYTLGPNFRNEGIDDEHLQEYYQLEWYWAYADYRDNMKLVRELLLYIARTVYSKTQFTSKGMIFDLADEWEEIDYKKILKTNGIDLDGAVSNERMLQFLSENGVNQEGGISRTRLIDNCWKVIRKKIAGPAFLINIPKFISPLAKSTPASIRGNEDVTERFQVILAGTEAGNGYSELNDPMDQYERFLEQQKARNAGDEEAQMMDIDYVEMLEYGMPPTSGYGQSERVFWLLEDIPAREATLFPQMKAKIDDSVKEIYPEFASLLKPRKIKKTEK